jgi:DNA-binding MarR family transcriptional regulator
MLNQDAGRDVLASVKENLQLCDEIKKAISREKVLSLGAPGLRWVEPGQREAVLRRIEEVIAAYEKVLCEIHAAGEEGNLILLHDGLLMEAQTPLEESMERQARKQAHLVPDIEYIRKRIPIQDVARALGLSVNGRQGHCWRIEAHQNGDRKPSMWFSRSNRVRCQVCDARPLSTVDLVMLIEHIDVVTAVNWIARRFSVPNVLKGKHLKSDQRWRPAFRVGTGDNIMEDIVRSGILAELDGAVTKVLLTFRVFADREGEVTISNRGLMQYAGVSQHTVTRAIAILGKLHLLERKKNGKGFRECSSYRLTVDDPKFQALAEDRTRQTQELVAAQRKQRAARRHSLRKAGSISRTD